MPKKRSKGGKGKRRKSSGADSSSSSGSESLTTASGSTAPAKKAYKQTKLKPSPHKPLPIKPTPASKDKKKQSKAKPIKKEADEAGPSSKAAGKKKVGGKVAKEKVVVHPSPPPIEPSKIKTKPSKSKPAQKVTTTPVVPIITESATSIRKQVQSLTASPSKTTHNVEKVPSKYEKIDDGPHGHHEHHLNHEHTHEHTHLNHKHHHHHRRESIKSTGEIKEKRRHSDANPLEPVVTHSNDNVHHEVDNKAPIEESILEAVPPVDPTTASSKSPNDIPAKEAEVEEEEVVAEESGASVITDNELTVSNLPNDTTMDDLNRIFPLAIGIKIGYSREHSARYRGSKEAKIEFDNHFHAQKAYLRAKKALLRGTRLSFIKHTEIQNDVPHHSRRHDLSPPSHERTMLPPLEKADKMSMIDNWIKFKKTHPLE